MAHGSQTLKRDFDLLPAVTQKQQDTEAFRKHRNATLWLASQCGGCQVM